MTRKELEQWIEANHPELAVAEINGHKGYYRQDVGPAQSFHTAGRTWDHVAQELGATAPK